MTPEQIKQADEQLRAGLNVEQAAARLGMDRRSFERKLAELGYGVRKSWFLERLPGTGVAAHEGTVPVSRRELTEAAN